MSYPRFILRTIVFFSALLFASAVYGQSIPGFQAPDKPKVKDDTPATVKAARGEVPFNRIYGHLKLAAAKTKRLGELSPSELKKNRKDTKLLRIGVVRPLLTPLDPISDSELYTVTEGYIRVAGVVSEGAAAVRVQFRDMSLPPGSRVFVYSPANPNEYLGPYEGRGPSEDGTFWTPAIQGDTAIIEYFTPAGNNSTRSPFKVDSVGHVYKDTSVVEAPAASCELEVTAEWQTVAKSVGKIEFVTGPFLASCTGTLLNNVANDQKPFFLTANHCISTQSEAQSAIVYWNYNTGDSPPGGTPQTNGAHLLATGETTDFTLLLLSGSVPGGLFYSGWDASAFNNTAPATGIHHPKGSHKRISFGTARQPAAGNCFPGQQCLRVDWSSGITEQGSSGSGIWIGNPSDPGGPRLIGDLSGGLSSCNGLPSQMWDIYARFSVAYPSMAPFLEATTCVTSLSSSRQFVASSAGTGSFDVTASGSCNWTALPTNSFVTITSGSSGSGNGTVNFSVTANNGPQRTAIIIVGGQVFTVTQAGGGPCTPAPISIGQTVNGNLTTNDCPADDGTFYDAYSFSGTAGQRISISMSSAEFDTFLILNRPDGLTLAFDDDSGGARNSRIPPSGFITLPVTGTYTIWANAFDPDDTTGAYSLLISLPVLRTLTVASSNPNSGAEVFLNPVDNNGFSSGFTQFTRTYDQNTMVSLTAQTTAPGNLIFLKWQKDGVDFDSFMTVSVSMDVDHTLTAVYGPIPNYTLTIGSTNPSSGVPIQVKTDNGVSDNGTTQFTRTYRQGTSVDLKATIDAGGTYFQKWQRDGQDVTTNRTVRTFMNANQTWNAVYITIPIPPPPAPTPTPSAPGQAVTYQIDPTHTGSQFDNTVSAPLVQRWSRDLGSSTGYPLIAGGRVFITAGSALYALNGTTGATVWGPIEIGLYPGIAYESGRVFAIARDGLLRAFDATSGTQVWSRQLGGQSFSSAPTAVGGTIYINSFQTFHALNTQDGTTKWTAQFIGSEHSSPAVTPTALYYTNGGEAFALSPATGSVIWRTSSSVFGSLGATPVFYNSRVYIRNNNLGNVALDSATGIPVAELQTLPAPAFHGSTGFYLNVSTLEAKDITTGALKWSFTGDGTLSSPPMVVNGVVYVGSTSGKLFAVDENSGISVWSGAVGAPVNRPEEFNLSPPLTGLGAGEGLIVVPASNLVVAYQSAPVPTPPMIYVEEGTNNALTVDSVTFLRGPFRLANPNNFSVDQRTRIVLLTSNLGLRQSDLSDPTALVVELAGVNLPVENVGSVTIPGLITSYIVVRLPNNAPTGNQELRIKLHGITSDARMLNISP